MKTGLKVLVGAIVVIGLGAGAAVYFTSKNAINDSEVRINNALAQIQTYLPAGATQENILNKGTFASTGVYTVMYKDESTAGQIKVTYHINHNIMNYLAGSYPVEAVTVLEGAAVNNLTLDGDFMKTTGSVKRDGSFDLKNTSPRMTISVSEPNEQGSLTIDPSNSHIKYDKDKDYVETEFNYPLIVGQAQDPWTGKTSVNIQDTKITRNFTLSQAKLGDLDISMKQVQNEMATLKDVKLGTHASLDGAKYNVDVYAKIGNVTVPMLQEDKGELDIKYSIKGISEAPIQYYQSRLQKMSENPDAASTPEEFEQLRVNLRNLVQEGFVTTLDKFHVKGKFGVVDASGKFEVPAVATPEQVSLVKNAIAEFKFKTEGNTAPLLGQVFSQMVGPQFRNTEDKDNTFSVNANYANEKAMLNGKDVTAHPAVEDFKDNLRELDSFLLNKEVQRVETAPVPLNPIVPNVPENGGVNPQQLPSPVAPATPQ